MRPTVADVKGAPEAPVSPLARARSPPHALLVYVMKHLHRTALRPPGRARLRDAKVIPTMLDGVAPSDQQVEMRVTFGDVSVDSGNLITPEDVSAARCWRGRACAPQARLCC